MSPKDFKPHNLRNCFPRVSGDEPARLKDRAVRNQFSPRERG